MDSQITYWTVFYFLFYSTYHSLLWQPRRDLSLEGLHFPYAPNTSTFIFISSAKLSPLATSPCNTVLPMTWLVTSKQSHLHESNLRNSVLSLDSSNTMSILRGSVVRWDVSVIPITIVTFSTFIYLYHSRSTSVLYHIHWRVSPFTIPCYIPYLLIVVSSYSIQVSTTQYLSALPHSVRLSSYSIQLPNWSLLPRPDT